MHLFNSKKRLIITIALGLYVLAVLRAVILHQFFEYPISSDPEKVAQWIVDEHYDPKACFKISGGIIPTLRPPDSSLQSLCVYKVAEKLQDPTVCELLMPDEYGLACIGKIWGPLIDKSNCHWYKTNEVRCFEGIELDPHIYNCSSINSSNTPDECTHRMAFKKKDKNICLNIQENTLRSICETRINAWNKYPKLRSTIYFNDDIE